MIGTSAEAFFTGAESTEGGDSVGGGERDGRSDGRTSASLGVASKSQSSYRRPFRITAIF